MTIPAYPSLPGLMWPVTRTPIWSTIKQDSWSGKSTPIQLWSYPRRRYTLAYEFLRWTQSEIQTLEGFYLGVGGSAGVFSFTDADDQAVTGSLFGTGDGVTRIFQLLRPWGGFYEPVYLPRGGFSIFVNGVQVTAYTAGSNPGLIVFSTPPANGAILTWTGSFDWLCRFDDDSIDFSKFMADLWSIQKIAITTVKL